MFLRAASWFKSSRWPHRLLWVLWAITLIGLPLTSFPLLTRLTGATVAPFSAIPVFALGMVWFVPYILRRGKLPKETLPFIIFVLYCIALAASAFFEVDEYFRNRPLFNQTVRTFIPLAFGLIFLLVTSAWHRDTNGLRRSLQFIHVGGFLLLFWAIVQTIIVFVLHYQYPPFLDKIRMALATQSEMIGNPRLAGLTWEASWFAHQLNMLYLPLWLAATYQRTSVFPRIGRISVENIFLVFGLGVFFLSAPRIGGAACMLMILFLYIKANFTLYRWIIDRLARQWSASPYPGMLKIGIGVILAVLFIAVYFGFSAAVLKIAGERDWRVGLLVKAPISVSEMQQIGPFNENTLFYLGMRFAFLERTVFWMDGWRIFNDHPLLGVGLGNAGYYFISHLPAIGWATYEIRAIIYQNASLPNIKSIWFRLLAETGIVGFSLFITWLLVLWSSASKSLGSQDATIKTLALAGQLALLAYVFEGFSMDTFGLPYLFVMAGLVASTGMVLRRQTIEQKTELPSPQT